MGQSLTSAPSNIALIKYMGKIHKEGNIPTNSSLSYTLEHLRTYVEIEKSKSTDTWELLNGSAYFPFAMSARGREKFLEHFQFLKNKWSISESFILRSANNFPADSGIASSASSFAALTLAAANLFEKINPQTWGNDVSELSRLSQRGSGSSCRSFFSPWSIWSEEGAQPLSLPQNSLHHLVIVPETASKKVSSSEAHLRVTHSSLFPGRAQRAQLRLEKLITGLRGHQWKDCFQIVWDEFIDMHQLFKHCPEPFDYRTEMSESILVKLQNLWRSQGDGPLVTMDAGSSIHLLLRPEQKELALLLKKEYSLLCPVWSSL